MSEEGQEVVARVAIKPPPFVPTNVPAWFQILEAQFKIANVTQSSSMFYHALSALTTDVVQYVPEDLLTQAEYASLKKYLVDKFESTKPELFEELLRSTALVGKPSHKLDQLIMIAKKTGVADDLVRHKFLSLLPPEIRTVLMTQETLALTELGKLADQISVAFAPRSSNSMAAIHTPGQQRDDIRSTNNSTTNSMMPRGLTPFIANQRPKVCRFHLYFGQKAKRCFNWCQWPNKNGCSVQSSTSRPNSRASSPAPAKENK